MAIGKGFLYSFLLLFFILCSPTPSSSQGGVSSIVSKAIFDKFFSNRWNSKCPAHGFYIYPAFLQAAKVWPRFGTVRDPATQRRELAAFFANAAHETTGGCHKEEKKKSDPLCTPSAQWGCAPGKKYYGRGPLQISHNYNYGQAGKDLGFDGIGDPDIVARDATISFKTAIWFWMTVQSKQSCHGAMLNGPGFGATIEIINGGYECGSSADTQEQQDRIKTYISFCKILGVDPGNNLTC